LNVVKFGGGGSIVQFAGIGKFIVRKKEEVLNRALNRE
jgi:hypothetical protein